MGNTKSNLWKYTLYSIYINLAFTRGIFMIFLKDHGLTTAQMGLLESILFIATFVMEVPTGILGDRIGRKWSMACGILVDIASTLIFIFRPTWPWLIVAFVLTGSSFAFLSGSDRALYFDSLKALGQEDEYLKRSSRLNTLGIITIGLAMVAGGFLQHFGWNWVYGASLVVGLANFFLIISFREVRIKETRQLSDAERLIQGNSMKQAFRYFFKERKGRLLVLFMLGIGLYEAFNTPFSIYNQILLDFHKLGTSAIGLIKGASTVTAALGAWLAGHTLAKKEAHKLIFVMMPISLVLVLLELFSVPWLAIAVYLLIDLVSEIVYVRTDTVSQEGIPSEVRASLLSTFSLFESFFIAIVYYVWGILMDRLNPPVAMGLLAIFIILAWIVIWKHERLSAKEKQEA